MENVTIPKTKYEILKRQALLYEKIFKFLPERFFNVEIYSQKRLKEFQREDRLDKKTKIHLQKLLKSL
jgi:hypothetical protein